ncbi:MAG TPA: hypothetical protein VHM20_01230 [Gammaproteobacteria bacterium]|jgi:hypothetical protein|nr:hypothetical protein [Gammaproteobacteria bacterium]
MKTKPIFKVFKTNKGSRKNSLSNSGSSDGAYLNEIGKQYESMNLFYTSKDLTLSASADEFLNQHQNTMGLPQFSTPITINPAQ